MVNLRNKPKESFGKVLSDKMDKTVVVAVTRLVPHPLYRKIVRRVSKFKAHDESNASRIGDWVRIVHTRPLSKDKHWKVAEIIERGERAQVEG